MMAETYVGNGIVRIRIYTARCNKCGCRFEHIPYCVHSAGVDGLPRCPWGGSYRHSAICEETR